MTHLNLPLGDYSSVVKINASELKGGLVRRPSSSALPDRERTGSTVDIREFCGLKGNMARFTRLLRTLPVICTELPDFLFT